MLQDIRDNSQGVIAKIIVGLIVAVFALWGVESIIGGFITSPSVAEVNGEEITEVQLQNSTQNLLASLGPTAGEFDQSLLEEIALNQLIEETVLRQRAEAGELTVSSDRIDRSILGNPEFQVGGRFDSDLAVRTMATRGYSVPGYRAELAKGMLLGQLANAFTASNFATDAEIEQIARLTRETRDFRYIAIPLGTRTLDSPITDAEISEYYEANQEAFREEESVVVNYVLLDQNQIAEELEVPEVELLEQYEAEREAFEGSTEKRAAHILFEVGGSLSEDEAIAMAQVARERLEAGEAFADLALELSSDTVSAEQGGDIGYSDGSAFPAPIEEVLEVLSVDEVSEPVVTEFGVHLVKLTEAADTEFTPFEEARARIEREIKSAEVELLYAERLETISNLAFESGDLESVAAELELEIQQSPPVTRNGAFGLFSNQAVIDASFSDSVFLEGNNSDAIELSDTQAIVLRLAQYNEATVPPLEEVEAQISVLLRAQKEREAVQELGQELMTAVTTGSEEAAEEFLDEYELAWISQEGVQRNGSVANAQIISEAFALPEPDGESTRSSITLANGTYVLLELTGVTAGSLEMLTEGERSSLRNELARARGNADLEAYLNSLRDSATIRRNAQALEDFQ